MRDELNNNPDINSNPNTGISSKLFFSVSSFLFIFSVVLSIFIYQLIKRMETLETENVRLSRQISMIETDISGISSELAVVGALARNADMYAHTHYSDIRLKENIKDIENPLEIISNLRGVTFTWKEGVQPQSDNNLNPQIGMIAQEVEPFLPEIISNDENGYKLIHYDLLTPILLEAIIDLEDQIQELKSGLQ